MSLGCLLLSPLGLAQAGTGVRRSLLSLSRVLARTLGCLRSRRVLALGLPFLGSDRGELTLELS